MRVKFEAKSFVELVEGLFTLEFGHFQRNGVQNKTNIFLVYDGTFPRKGVVTDLNQQKIRNKDTRGGVKVAKQKS